MTRHSPILALLALIALLAAPRATAQLVGASLSLEGRAAILRAADFLCQQQAPDGSWQQRPDITALTAEALIAANGSLQQDAITTAVTRALALLRQDLPSLPDTQLALAARPLLRLHSPADTAPLQNTRKQLTQIIPATADDALWLADALRLTAGVLRLPTDQTPLPADHNALPPSSPARQLALLLASGNATETSVRAAYATARHTDCSTAPFDDLYWLARAAQAVNKANIIPYDHWKADILSALLDRQRGNGAWNNSQDQSEGAPRTTAAAILTIILCLAD